MELAAAISAEMPIPKFEELERGGVVGRVDLGDCVNDYDSLWFTGKFGFVMANPRPLSFLPYKGQLGLFEIPDNLLAEAT